MLETVGNSGSVLQSRMSSMSDLNRRHNTTNSSPAAIDRTKSSTTSKCSYCRSDFAASSVSANAIKSAELVCDKCKINETKYGKPTTCTYCRLPAAFLGGKCVYCSHAERKFGAPRVCTNCKLKAAFLRPNQTEKKLLCRLCTVSYERSLKKAQAKQNKRKAPESETGSAKKSKVGLTADNEVLSDQILMVTQLKDQIATQQRELFVKDQKLIEKDKKLAILNGQIMQIQKEKDQQLVVFQKQAQETQEVLQEKIRHLSRQVASLTKGRRQMAVESSVSASASASPSA